MMLAADRKRHCPCGYTSRIDNVTRHIKKCKRASTESLRTALIAKESALEAAQARISELEAKSTTNNITVVQNNTVHNHVTINVRPFLDWLGGFLSESDMPARAVVQKMMTKVDPPQVVPSYLKLKHCHSGPEYASVRVKDPASDRLEMVKEVFGEPGHTWWAPMSKATYLPIIVQNAFEQVNDYHIDPASDQGQAWTDWIESESLLTEEGYLDTKQDAFKRMVKDTEEELHKGYRNLHVPREPIPQVQSVSE